ncbi:MAG: threonine--tRNA ligase [Chitinispirillia bacterium]|jgi:threonyl-tRNA synthetase
MGKIISIILPDGKSFVIDENATVGDLALSIGTNLAKSALAGKVNGKLVDLTQQLKDKDRVEIITFSSAEGKMIFWHSSSHIMAQAVQELFPSAKIAIGPAIDSGFYYDFDIPNPFTPEDLVKIEKQCYKIIAGKIPFVRKECSEKEALDYFENKSEIYKIELLNELEGDPSIYSQGMWQDLCRGPHVPHTGVVKAIKLLSCAGAYWRGSEKNKMLQRIYGISFPKKSMLEDHLRLLEEAQKRDHRKLGKTLDLFSFHHEGTGFPFWHPKGMVIYNEVMDYCRQEHLSSGYQEVKTPIILNEDLWHRSGHWDKYKENMYFTEIDDSVHAIKPMNCPGGLLIFNNSSHSYRELPIKNFEFGLVHRHEKAGVLHGLFRVRQFTQDDAHIFCERESIQIEEQIGEVIDFIFKVYNTFGFTSFNVELSTRPEIYIGEPEVWDLSEKALENVLKSKNIDYKINPGDGAFYGPKIDFHILDSLNRSWQCGTIQVDFSMPIRFNLEYTAANGERKTPVMIHRALLGSMERFIGILIENYAGFLPLWLSPVQVKVIPISQKFFDYTFSVFQLLKKEGIRAEVDTRDEKIGYKIRDAEINKIPYMVIIGEKEVKANTVSVRKHKKGDKGTTTVHQFIEKLKKEITEKNIQS